ncbi:MAG: hypothetical protein HY401_05090 [Elusimicrobia bacterium]|nr:hypothetical protein [Elusimicrobiota bacterium]
MRKFNIVVVLAVSFIGNFGLQAAEAPEQLWMGPAVRMEGVRAKGAASAVSLKVVAPQGVAVELPIGTVINKRTINQYTEPRQARPFSWTRGAASRETEFTLESPVYLVTEWTGQKRLETTFWDRSCDYVVGDGRGDWRGFFNAPRYEKPKRLADAIKGIDKSAACVIESGAFSSKPRHWDAFKERIAQADAYCRKQGFYGIYTKVIVEFGRDNSRNLGYEYEGSQNCTWTQIRQPVWVEVTDKDVADTGERIRRVVRVQIVSGGDLLPSESEAISFSFDGSNVGNSNTALNHYYGTPLNFDGERVDYELRGQRQRVTPSNTLLFQVTPGNGEKLLNIRDTDYVAGSDNPEAQTLAVLTLYRNRTGWTDEKLHSTPVLLNNGQTVVALNQSFGSFMKPGKTYYIQYALQRRNSRFNNDNAAKEKEGYRFDR